MVPENGSADVYICCKVRLRFDGLNVIGCVDCMYTYTDESTG